MDPKSHKCFFIGYGENTNGYKLQNPLTLKYFYSIDVIFRDSKLFLFLKSQKRNTRFKKIVFIELKK